MKIKQLLLSLYFIVFLISVTYQDLYLANYFGEIFRTPIILLFPIFILLELYFILSKKVIITKLQKKFLFFVCSLSLISIFYVLGLFFSNKYIVLEEQLFIKAIKGIVYFVLIFFFIRHAYFLFKVIERRYLLYSFLTVFTFLNTIMGIEYFMIPNSLLFLHSSNDPYYRIRLLTLESSWTGTIYIVFVFIIVHLAKGIKNIFISILIKSYSYLALACYILITGSKGFLVLFFISLLIISIKYIKIWKPRNLLSLIGIVLIFLLGFSLLMDQLLLAFVNDITKYTSIATRLGMFIISIKVFLMHPFGVGTGAHIYFLSENIDSTIKLIKEIFDVLFNLSPNVTELESYKLSTKGLAIKAGVFHWLVLGGIFSLLFFISLFRLGFRMVKNDTNLKFAFIFVCLSTLIYITLEIKYEIWLLIAFIEYNFLYTSYKGVEKNNET